MQAFVPFDGSRRVVDGGAARPPSRRACSCGAPARIPVKIRMLLPVNTTDEELEAGFAMLEKALARVGEERELPC